MLTILESSQAVKHTENLTHTQTISFSQMWTQIARWGFSSLKADSHTSPVESATKSLPLTSESLENIQLFPLSYTRIHMHTNKRAHKQPYTINKYHLYANDPDRNSDTSKCPALATTITGFFQQASRLRESWYKQTSLHTAKIVVRHSQIFTKDLFTSVTQYSWMGV